jgi:hypothetical protein
MKFNSPAPNADKLAYHKDKPDIQLLTEEYERSAYFGTMVSKMNIADDIRLARWSGQTEDGKKHSWARPDGDPAFPFEGASDVRVRLVDRLINDQKALLMTSFKGCTLKVGGTEISDTMAAASSTNLMRWLVETKMKHDLHREAELAADYALTYGWSVIQTTWEQQMSIRIQSMRMTELQQMAMEEQQEGGGEGNFAKLVNAIQDPSKEEYAISLVRDYLKDMKVKDLRKFVKQMRETGVGEMPEQYLSKNLPVVEALKPFDEICFPPETTDLQKARIIFRRQYMTEVELRSTAKIAGWTPEWVEAVANNLGNHYYFNDPNLVPTTTMLNSNIMRGDNLCEIVWAYYRQLDNDDVPAIYYTVFSPRVGEGLYGKQDILNYAHGEYPFTEFRRERHRRAVSESRGIPEINKTEQDEVKAQHDAIRDRTAFEVVPPIKVVKRIGALNRIAPAQILPVSNKDDYTWLDRPSGDANMAFQVIAQVEQNLGNYYGYAVGESIDPTKIQMLKQLQVDHWLSFWTKVFGQMFSLCLQFMPEEQIVRITNTPLKQGLSDIHSQYDFNVRFDVRDTDPEFVQKKLEAIIKTVVPLDSGGIIDRNKLVKLVIESISPDAARELVIDQATASQKLYKDVVSDIGLMMLGNEAQYIEGDPAASSKLQFAQQVLQKNPKAQQALQGDQIFQILFQNYMKQLQFSIDQEKNAQIGRIGVSPASEEIQEEFGKAQEEQAPEEGAPQQQVPNTPFV